MKRSDLRNEVIHVIYLPSKKKHIGLKHLNIHFCIFVNMTVNYKINKGDSSEIEEEIESDYLEIWNERNNIYKSIFNEYSEHSISVDVEYVLLDSVKKETSKINVKIPFQTISDLAEYLAIQIKKEKKENVVLTRISYIDIDIRMNVFLEADRYLVSNMKDIQSISKDVNISQKGKEFYYAVQRTSQNDDRYSQKPDYEIISDLKQHPKIHPRFLKTPLKQPISKMTDDFPYNYNQIIYFVVEPLVYLSSKNTCMIFTPKADIKKDRDPNSEYSDLKFVAYYNGELPQNSKDLEFVWAYTPKWMEKSLLPSDIVTEFKIAVDYNVLKKREYLLINKFITPKLTDENITELAPAILNIRRRYNWVKNEHRKLIEKVFHDGRYFVMEAWVDLYGTDDPKINIYNSESYQIDSVFTKIYIPSVLSDEESVDTIMKIYDFFWRNFTLYRDACYKVLKDHREYYENSVEFEANSEEDENIQRIRYNQWLFSNQVRYDYPTHEFFWVYSFSHYYEEFHDTPHTIDDVAKAILNASKYSDY